MSMYIGDETSEYSTGQIGFLVERSNPVRRSEYWGLRDHPAAKNLSGERVLFGWCGSFNNTSTNAHGVWRVVRVCRNGRAQVVELKDAELESALDQLGYPELAPLPA